MHLVVDGYNLGRSGAVPLSEDPTGEKGREELCALLASYARDKGMRLTVVFDGGGRGGTDRSRIAFKGGTALFSSRGETADDVIREITRSAAAGTVVVTSDRGLAGTLPSRTVSVIACDAFAERLAAWQLAGLKGGGDEEEERPRGTAKKGEGHRKPKRERARERTLKGL